MKKIAILGVTGYIGRSLLREFFLEKKGYTLFLFSRSQEKITTIIRDVPKSIVYSVHSFSEFNEGEYDAIINCTGISGISILKENPLEIFKVTEDVDSLIISYLQQHPKAHYVNISSGAVYGNSVEERQDESTVTTLSGGFIGQRESYTIAKINAEAKHRSLTSLNIVDLRVFAFFSSLVDTDSLFLMTEIVNCIQTKKVLATNSQNMVRDYITPKDLLMLIKSIIAKKKINNYFDVYSKKPISKFDLLASMNKKYGLEFEIKKDISKAKSSPSKNIYASKSKKATKLLGYKPTTTSLEGILEELQKFSFHKKHQGK